MDLTDYITRFLRENYPIIGVEFNLVEHIGLFDNPEKFVNWLFENDESFAKIPDYVIHCINRKTLCDVLPNIDQIKHHPEKTGYFLIPLSLFPPNNTDWDVTYDFYYVIRRKKTRSLF